MKKYLFLLLSCVCCVIVAKGYTVLNLETGQFETTEQLPSYEVSCDTIDNGFIITYTFHGIGIVEDESNSGLYHCLIDGFGNNRISGLPEVPQRNDRILLPYPAQYTLSMINTESSVYDLRIINATEPLDADGNISEYLPFQASSSGTYPDNFVELDTLQCYRGNHFLYFTVSPTKYDSAAGKTTIAKTISFKLLEDTAESISALTDNNIARESNGLYDKDAINNQHSFRPELTFNMKEGFMIITTNSLLSSVNKLAEWKKMQGYDVELRNKVQWTEDEVFDAINNWYTDDNHARYFLLIGDNIQIPNKTSYDKKKTSDFYYACLDGRNDYLPDLQYGRIPASTFEQADNAISKIIAYEKNPNPRNNDSHFSAISFFQPYMKSLEREDNHRFIFQTDIVYRTISNAFDNSRRIYYCEDNVNPKYWFDNSPIPDYLKKPNFNWNSSKEDIISTINGDAHFMLFNTHGTDSAWAFPWFDVNDINRLNNKVHPIILSMSCHTGDYTNPKSIATNLLFLKDYGCSTILAATNVSFSPHNYEIGVGIYNSIWPSMGLTYNWDVDFAKPDWSTNEYISLPLGEGLLNGFNLMISKEDKPMFPTWSRLELERFIILGDPSINIFWDTKTNVKDLATISYKDASVKVSMKGKPAIITFYDKVTGDNQRTFAKTASFTTNDPDNVYITATLAGAAPLCGWFSEFSTDSETTVKKFLVKSCEYDGKKLNIEIQCDEEEWGNVNIEVIRLRGGIAQAILNDEIDTTISSFYLQDVVKNDILAVGIRRNNELIYTKKIIVL